MFTTIIHPKDGRELQIKTGSDACETYRIGDRVEFYINKNIFGSGGIFDGVYDSFSDKGVDDWIIIKDRKIIAVRSKSNKYEKLIKQYKIRKPSRRLWTDRAYKKHLIQQKKLEIENKKFDESIKNLSPHEKFAAVFARPIMERMNYKGIMRRVFNIKPMRDN